MGKIYFIGIGGIGMSAIARYFLDSGKEVHGYDKTSTVLTRQLEAEGMKIHYEDNVNLIPEGVELVVWTPAIKDLRELDYFKNKNIPLKKRAEVLGMISRSMKTVAIGGTHGKTTTSSLTAHLLKVGGLDNVAFLGGIAENYKSNYIKGAGEWVVVEADEFDRSFLHLHPDIAVVTSMDADHLDIYGTDEEIKKTFNFFANQTKEGGIVLTKQDLPLVIDNEGVVKEFYGVDEGSFQSKNLRSEGGFFVFDYESPLGNMSDVQFTTPGKHNVENATVAIAIAQYLKVTEEKIREGLATFKGIKRRFEFLLKSDTIVYIDDYAHHPTELNAAIGSARMLYPDKKILGIFQPHLYSRTRDFQEGFAEALDALDEILLMDIYPARELPIEGVTSEIVFSKMQNAHKQRVTKENLMEALAKTDFDIILTLGAGDIDLFREPIKEYCSTKLQLGV
jgi:UDP-N-acetylmuramate--alanine ligase